MSEVNLLDLFIKHASSEAEAKRVYRLVEENDILSMTLNDLMGIRGVGRKALLLIVEVAADLKGKK